MSRLPLVLRVLHRTELSLGRTLFALAERHRADPEIRHVARDMAGWPTEHVGRLAEAAAPYGLHLDPTPRFEFPAVQALSGRVSRALAHRSEPGLLLLADLRRLHRKASGVSLDWELLAQSAQAMQQQELLDLARTCRPQTLRVVRWADAHLKVASPQVIAG